MESIVIRDRTERTKWFNEARFGMFIHWGAYAIPARGEWLRSTEQLSIEEYQPFVEEFNPTDFQPKKWAKLAKKAGMKYAVLTAKHHDGFCLFDSKLTDYKTTTYCGRDLVAEYLEAFRAEGIKVGLYFSIIDWHHPDFPHYGDRQHPMRNDESEKNDGRNWDNYLTYMHGQVRELLTNYGKLDIMWYDFSYTPDMYGEKWKAEELMAMVRELQPHIVVDNRLEGSGEKSGTILTADPTTFAGDFAAPEQMIPPTGVVNVLGDPVPWEACITLNNNWGYASEDHHYKSAKMVIRMLTECVSKNGNLLLNVGPDAKGRIPKESVEILEEVGEWMADNSDSIYGCGKSDFAKPEWGRYTQKGNKLYAHVYEEQVGAICLEDLAGKVEKLRLLSDGSEIKQTFHWNLTEYPKNAFFFFNSRSADCYPLPDERDTVVEITLKD